MATIVFGGGIVDARGSVAGNTFSRNASGAYQRARIAGVNPSTPRQNAIRNALSMLSGQWRGLTEAERTEWVAAAETTLGQYTNRAGQPSQYTGQQLFMQLGLNEWLLGGGGGGGPIGPQDPPPASPIPGITIDSGSAVESGGVLTTLSITLGGGGAGTGFLLYASPPSSAGLMRSTSARYKYLDGDSSGATGAVPILTEYSAVFGPNASAGESIWVKVVPMSPVSFKAGPPQHIKLIVAAGP